MTSTVDELWNKSALDYTDEEIDAIVLHFRQEAEAWAKKAEPPSHGIKINLGG